VKSATPVAQNLVKFIQERVPEIQDTVVQRAPGVWNSILFVVGTISKLILKLLQLLTNIVWGMFKAGFPGTAKSIEQIVHNTEMSIKATIERVQRTYRMVINTLNGIAQALGRVAQAVVEVTRPGVDFVLEKTEPIRLSASNTLEGLKQELVRVSSEELKQIQAVILAVLAQTQERVATALMGVEESERELFAEGRHEAIQVAEGVLQGASTALGSAKDGVDAVAANVRGLET